jgi:hypothetical protein
MWQRKFLVANKQKKQVTEITMPSVCPPQPHVTLLKYSTILMHNLYTFAT